MSAERKQRLDDIDFVWDALDDLWEDGFAELLQFKERNGHCRVTQRGQINGFQLGHWVGTQRRNKDTMLPERKKRLDEIGFIWDVLTEAWEEGFSALLQFKKIKGHCRVVQSCKQDGFNLGIWVATQRSTEDTMLPERKKRLDEIGFIWAERKTNNLCT